MWKWLPLLLLSGVASAQDVLLRWQPPTECTDGSTELALSYFSIYRGLGDATEELPVSPTAAAREYLLTEQLSPEIPERCYRMTATGQCADGGGESAFSNTHCVEFDGTLPPGAVQNLRIEWAAAPDPEPPPGGGGEMTTLVLTNNAEVQNVAADVVVADAIAWTMLDSLNPDAVATSGSMHVRRAGGARSRSIILLPDFLPEVPADRTIISATMYLGHNDANWSGGDVAIRRMLTEYTIGQATWNERSTSTAWASTGSQGDDTDRVAAASDVLTVPDEASGYFAYDITADVAAMYAGSVDPRGWILECDSGGVLLGTTMPDATTSFKPEFVIVHEAAATGETGSTTDGAESDAAFAATVHQPASLSAGAAAGDQYAPIAQVSASLVAAAGSADTHGDTAAAIAALSAGATGDATLDALTSAAAALAAGGAADEAWVAEVQALAELIAGGAADASFSAETAEQAQASLTAGGASDAQIQAAAAAVVDVVAAAAAGASMSADPTIPGSASIAAGSASAEQFGAAVQTLADLVAGGSAAAAMAGVANAIGVMSAGGAAGEQFEAQATDANARAITAGGAASELWSAVAAVNGSILESVGADAIWTATGAVSAAIAERAAAGAQFVARLGQSGYVVVGAIRFLAAVSGRPSIRPAVGGKVKIKPH